MSFVWPSEDGWPYPDADCHPIDIDLGTVFDDDVLSVMASPHFLDHLDPLERRVIKDHYGLSGTPARSMKQLSSDLDMPRSDLRDVLGAGLSKLRVDLA